MALLTLNLLSPRKKTRLLNVVRFLFTKELLEFAVLTSAFLAITYLLGWIVLTNTFNGLTVSVLLVNRETPTYNQEIRNTNSLLRDTIASAAGYRPLTPRLNEIIDHLPPDIHLTTLVIDQTAGSLVMTGVAQTRDALLGYESALGHFSDLEKLPDPYSELFQKDNVNFEIHARLKHAP